MSELAAIKPTSELPIVHTIPMDRNPAAIFLASQTPNTRVAYKSDLTTIARILGADDAFSCNWGALKYQHTQAIRTMLQETISERTGKLLKPSMVNRMLCSLRGVLGVAWKLGLMDADDYHRAVDIKGVKYESLPAGRELSIDEIQALLDACMEDPSPAGVRDTAIISVAYACGLRRAEIASLEVTDYDPNEGRLIIHGKGNRQRTVYVGEAELALEDWLKIRVLTDGNKSGALFLAVGRTGKVRPKKRVSTETIYNVFLKRGEQAGLSNFSPHDLRRTNITHLLSAGVDPITVAKCAGHKNVNTTMKYDKRGDNAKRKAVGMLHVPYHGRNNRNGRG